MSTVVWFSDAIVNPTGFGIASKYACLTLKQLGFKVYNLTVSTYGSFDYEGIRVMTYTNITNLLKLKPNYVILFGAPFIFPISNILNDNRYNDLTKTAKVLIYGIHEGITISPQINDYFTRGHLVLAPTNAQLKTYFMIPQERKVRVVHSLDIDKYEPIDASQAEYDLGMIAQNHPRKRWDLFLKLLALVNKKGYMKTTLQGYWNIEAIGLYWVKFYQTMINYKVDDDVYTEEELAHKCFSNFKVNTHITNGEAFAYPVIQSLLLTQPVFVTKHPAMEELYGDIVEYIPSDYRLYPDGIEYVEPDVNPIITKVNEVLQHYKEYSDKLLSKRNELKNKFDYRYNSMSNQLKYAIAQADKFDKTIRQEYFYPKITI